MDGMPEILLLIVCGFLWAILVAVKKCLAELSKITARLDVTNGLLDKTLDGSEIVAGKINISNNNLRSIDKAVAYFHEAAVNARGGR